MDEEHARQELRERRIRVALVVLSIAVVAAAAIVVVVVLSDRKTVTAPLSPVIPRQVAVLPAADRPGPVTRTAGATGPAGSHWSTAHR